MIELARRRRHDERGLAIPLIALLATVILLSMSFAVDLGRLVSTNRDIQKVADLAALDSLREVDTVSTTSALQAAVDTAADESATRNGFGSDPSDVLTAVLGTWDSATETFTPTSASEVPDAVQVTVTTTIDRLFQVGDDTPSRSAVATRLSRAAISFGSRLASVDASQADLFNDILNDAFDGGGAIGVTAASYTGLAGASVTIDELATELGVGTPDEVFTSITTVDDMLTVMADALNSKGDAASAAVLSSIVLATGVVGVDAKAVFKYTADTPDLSSDENLQVLGLLTNLAIIADGDNFLNVPSLTAGIPGITIVGTSMTITEGERYLKGPAGLSASTAQIRLDLDLTVSIPVTGVLGGTVEGDLPVSVELGGLTSEISAIECDSDDRLFVTATPEAANATVDGDLTVKVSGVPVLDLTAEAASTSANPPSTLIWNHPADLGVTQSVGSTTVGLDGLSFTTTGTTTLGPLPLPLVDLLLQVYSDLSVPLASVDSDLVAPIAELLGMRYSGGDVTMNGVECDAPRLVG